MLIELTRLESPVGAVVLAVCEAGLCALDFADDDAKVRRRLERAHPDARFSGGKRPSPAAARVQAYFEGELTALEGLEVAPAGTEFQRKVWAALRAVPVGTTTSYGAIARAIGRPSAVRAVGAANGQNPIALVLPCHRVIAADGTLGGYAGGLWRKRWLLTHEGALLV